MRWGNRLGADCALALVATLAACHVTRVSPDSAPDAGPREAGASSPDANLDAGPDARSDAAPPDDGGPDVPWWYRPFNPLPENVCALRVGAECDGHEDCDDGQVCCGEFTTLGFTYTRIGCSDRCEGANRMELCHPGDACRVEGQVCRRSFVIPYDFLAICAEPNPTVSAPPRGEAVAGKIACGGDECIAGREQCCLRARYEIATRTLQGIEPYCASLDHTCDCNPSFMPVDAGMDGGGMLIDGGDEDAGLDEGDD